MAVWMSGTVLTVLKDDQETQLGALRAISEIKMDSDMVDVTTLDAPGGFRTFAKGLRQAGDVTVDGFCKKGDAGQNVLRQLYFAADPAQFTITYPDGDQVHFQALVKSLSLGGGEVDSVVKFSAALRLTGPVTFS